VAYEIDIYVELSDGGPVKITSAGESIPLPGVGDVIDCEINGQYGARRVVFRHFTYSDQHIGVFLMVEDLTRHPITGRDYGVGRPA
jgi:hypothetical protein